MNEVGKLACRQTLLLSPSISHIFPLGNKVFTASLWLNQIHLFGCEIRAVRQGGTGGPCDRSGGDADLVTEFLPAFYVSPIYCKW